MSKRSNLNARAAAAKFLSMPMENRLGAGRRKMADQVEAKDRALFHELVAGTTRREVTIDSILAAFSNAPIKRIERKLRNILRLAIYQLVFLDGVPAHAAVSESLKLIPSKRARGFANGILRQIDRESSIVHGAPEGEQRLRSLNIKPNSWFVTERPFLPDPDQDPLIYLAIAHGFSPSATKILVKALGDEVAEKVLALANGRPQVALRFCGSKDQQAKARALVAEAGIDLETIPGNRGDICGLGHGVDPVSIVGFKEGQLTVQGPFAASVAPLLAPAAGERILDFCAPPGGKTIHLAELAPEAEIVAYAHDSQGNERLLSTLARCPRENITVATKQRSFWGGEPFDAYLVDVPCSNTGVLSRRPEARHRLDKETLASLAKLQRTMLDRVLSKALEHTGKSRLVYSTCSILPAENEDIVRAATRGQGRLRVVEERHALPEGLWQDGGYAALIEVSEV